MGLVECDALLLSIPDQFKQKRGKVSADLTQVQRIELLLKAMSVEQRNALFTAINKADLTKVRAAVTADAGKLMAMNSGTNSDVAFLVSDLIQFGEIYPGIFSLVNADQAVMGTLNLIRKSELKKKVEHPDLLVSLGRASRMRSTIDSTLANLIQQATVEYYGHTFGRKFWSLVGYNLKRWFFPTYKPVVEIMEWAQEVQKQLYRIREIDRVIVNLALSDADKKGMTDQEVEQVMAWVLNSPKELEEIDLMMKKVFGAGYGKGKAGETGKFDIYKSAKLVRDYNYDEMYRNFDKVNMKSLDQMVEALNDSAARNGKAERTIKDYHPVELQLRFEAAEREMGFMRDDYNGWTAQKTTEFYKVEESYQQAHTGYRTVTRTGSDGKTTTETESYTYHTTEYRDRRVNPSFEMILSRNWDKGDRQVWGLEEVKIRTHQVAANERPSRDLISEVENFISSTSENYGSLYAQSTTEKMAQEATALLENVRAMIEQQTKYYNSRADKIIREYERDNIENFKGRNGFMLNRLLAAEKALTQIAEIGRRPLASLYPPFEIYDFSDWVIELRKRRNLNFAGKIIPSATATVFTIAAIAIPQVGLQVSETAREVADYISDTGRQVTNYFENITGAQDR